jgi:tetratricopeptide (TPR) repeat protein
MSDVLLRLIGARDPNCPGEADVLAYSENRLSRFNRSRFEHHFAGCYDCRELLAFLGRESVEVGAQLADKAASEQTHRVLDYIQRDERQRSKPAHQPRAAAGFHISYPRLASVGLVIAAIAVASVLLFTMKEAPADAAMEALRLAVKDARHIQTRVSGGLEYSSYSMTRGSDRNDDDLQFSRALSKLRSAEQENAPASDRIVLARVYLARGTREDASRALTILTQLAARGVETPEALNDTGVAQFQLDNYDDAIAYFSRALAKSPGYDEALFNRALAQERAHRDVDARQDWQHFIAQSPDDKWKAEARTHLNSLGG